GRAGANGRGRVHFRFANRERAMSHAGDTVFGLGCGLGRESPRARSGAPALLRSGDARAPLRAPAAARASRSKEPGILNESRVVLDLRLPCELAAGASQTAMPIA